MRRAPARDTIGPIETVLPLFQQTVDDGDFDTSCISRYIPDDDDENE